MHEHDDLGLLAADEVSRFLVREYVAPTLLQSDNVGTLAVAHLGETTREVAVGEDRHLGALFDEVHDRGLHARRPRARHSDRELVPRTEHVSKQVRRVLQDAEATRVGVPDNWRGHGLVDARIHHAGPGAEEDAMGWVVAVERHCVLGSARSDRDAREAGPDLSLRPQDTLCGKGGRAANQA